MDQVYIADTIAGVILVLDKVEHRFDAYNIATGQAPTIAEIAAAVNRAVPGARITVGDGLYRPGGTVLSAVKGALDIRRAEAELGYRLRYDIQAGITDDRLTPASAGGLSPRNRCGIHRQVDQKVLWPSSGLKLRG